MTTQDPPLPLLANSLGGRLGIALTMCDLRPPDVARLTGIPVASINALIRRRSDRSAYTEQILNVLSTSKVSHEWVRTGKGPRYPMPVVGSVVASISPIGSAIKEMTPIGSVTTGMTTVGASVNATEPSLTNEKSAFVIDDCIHVSFRANTSSTVDREAFDALTKRFAQDPAFVVHLALARLRDAVQAGEPISITF